MYTLYLLIKFIIPNLSCIQQRWRNLSIEKFGENNITGELQLRRQREIDISVCPSFHEYKIVMSE